MRFTLMTAGLLGALTLGAVQTSAQEEAEAPLSIGLVLSGGAAKGLAHVGVLEVLEELGVPIDVVTGTSMGSFVGGLYAVGYDAAALRTVVLEADWDALLVDQRERDALPLDQRSVQSSGLSFPIRNGRVGLPTGVVRGERMLRLLERLTWRAQAVRRFDELPIPFAAVATDLESGDGVLLRRGSLARAIRASMTIPGVVRPQELDGRLLVDGAVARNLPAQDARTLGADLLICSDVSSPLDSAAELTSFFDVVMQTVTFGMAASTQEQRRLCDVLIEPDTDGMSSFSFDDADEWIMRGREAARIRIAELEALAARVGVTGGERLPDGRAGLVWPDSLVPASLEFRGLSSEAERIARRTVSIDPGDPVSAPLLDRALARLYATDLFAQAAYDFVIAGPDTTLVFDLVEEAQDRLGVGFRYDDHRKAALMFSATVHNLFDFGSRTRLDLRLGEEFETGLQTVRSVGAGARLSLAADLRYTRALWDIYQEDVRVSELQSRVAAFSGEVSLALGRTTALALGVHLERAKIVTSIAPVDSAEASSFFTLRARLWRDTFDRPVFPSRGLSLLVRTEWADRSIGSGTDFRLHMMRAEQALPLTRALVLRLRAVAGAASGAELPPHREFFLGGAFSAGVFGDVQPVFWGLDPQQRSGRAVQALGVALQAEVRDKVFVLVGSNVGNTFSEWTWSPSDLLWGWGVHLGALTPVGPLELAITGRDFGDWPDVRLNLGFIF